MSQAVPQEKSGENCDEGPGDPEMTANNASTPHRRRRRRVFYKLIRAATAAAGEEILASWLAHDRGKNGSYVTSRVPKMAFYGAFIKAPLAYFLLKGLRAIFLSYKSNTARVLEILIGMFVIAPIQQIVHHLSMALIAGARTFHQLRATVKAGLLPTMCVIWVVVPFCVAFAQNFLPRNIRPQFFGLVSFLVDTFANSMIKKKRLAALRRKHFGDMKKGNDSIPPPPDDETQGK